MNDAAAFKATFAGFRSLTDGDYRISFDFPGEILEDVVAVLTQGGKPSAAKGTWFAIARLNKLEDRPPVVQPAPEVTPPARVSNKLAQTAHIHGNDPRFQAHIVEHEAGGIFVGTPGTPECREWVKNKMKEIIGVVSFNDITADDFTLDRFERLLARYDAETRV